MSIMFIFLMVTFFISNVYLYPDVQPYETDMLLSSGRTQGLPCGCPNQKRPVCGSNMITYNNICVFRCDQRINPKLTIIARKACKNNRLKKKVNCNCPNDINFLCGSDDITYMNKCYFKCYQEIHPKLTIVKGDACFEVDRELFEMNHPINKRMNGFDNIVGRTRKHTWDCTNCPKDIHLLCGSDDITYKNECYFECTQEIHPSLTIVKEDACYEVDRELFEMNQPIKKRMNGFDNIVGIRKHSWDCTRCPKHIHLLCGSDDITYKNECYFECNQERHPQLTIIKEDVCYEEDRVLDCTCSEEFKIVCGSDNKIYMNECSFKCHQKVYPELTIINGDDICWPGPRSL